MGRKKYLSREVYLYLYDSETSKFSVNRHPLSVVEIESGENGIVSLKVYPFEKEEAGVEYSDVALHYYLDSDGKWNIGIPADYRLE